MRRPEGAARGDRDGVAPGDHPDLHHPPVTQQLSLRVEEGLGRARQGSQAGDTAAGEAAALDAFVAFSEKWEQRYPAIIKLWENAWAEFVPFLAFDTEIRSVICTTNSIESLNSRIRRAVNARGHFPTEQAALKCIYLAIMSLDPTGKGRQRWMNRWKAPLNAFELAFPGRLTPGRK